MILWYLFQGGLCWVLSGLFFFVLQHYVYFRGIRHTLQLYAASNEPARKHTAKLIMKLADAKDIIDLYNFNISMAWPSGIFLILSLIFGPLKFIDFAKDVIFYTFTWRPTNDASDRNQEN